MPEFKIVVSNPNIKNPKVIPVKVVGLEDLKYTDRHKEQRELPRIRVNPSLLKLLGSDYRVVVVRIWKNRANREKVNFVGLVEEDSSLDIQTVGIPLEFMREKLGAAEALGEVFVAPSFQIRVSGDVASRLLSMRIGERFDGSILGLKGVTLEIRGGSDLAGFPMRADVQGPVKKYVLLSEGPGFRPREEGERRRKLIRGNTVSDDIVQINTVIVSS